MGKARLARDVVVDADRIKARLDELATVGRDPHGGISRFAFTPAHAEACLLVAGWMRAAGLEVWLDPAGNLVGHTGATGPAVAAGSHLDTVPRGGAFDGALGVVAAVECAQALQEVGEVLAHPFAALAFADEEGYSFGIGCLTSQHLIGHLSSERMRGIQDRQGRSLAERRATWNCPLPQQAVPDLAAYLELHIEQGPRLDQLGVSAGAGTAIVGISRTTVNFKGNANHAGTTPLEGRQDALWGAAALVLAVRDLALRTGGEAVGTVGQLEVEPGSTNVVPGRALARVELRSPDSDRLISLRREVEAAAHRYGEEFGLGVEIAPWEDAPPVAMDERIIAMIVARAGARGVKAVRLPSWAGHDAKNFARLIPTGLIFVPSRGGVSHSPGEFTDPVHAVLGAQLLLDTVREIDRQIL